MKPKGRHLELTVRLSTAPDPIWKNELARISQTNAAPAKARKEPDEPAYAACGP